MSDRSKTYVNGVLFDFSGMKSPQTLLKEGYDLQASATNGRNLVTSYVAKQKSNRVLGYYDYQQGGYIEEPIC